jgi:hypothetical protein
MSRQIILNGTTANDATGDNLRVTADKINNNFSELYGFVNNYNAYTLPIAAFDTLGGVKIGSGLTIDHTTGLLSAQTIAALNDLTDVTLVNPSVNQILKYDGAQWINSSAPPANPFDQDLNTTNEVKFVKVTAEEVDLSGSGTPTVYSETDLYLSASGSIEIITKSPFRLATMNTAERNTLTASNGDMIYNTSTNKFQGYANGTWVDLN